MPLSSESEFGFKALTNTINNLPATPTILRSLGLFKPKYLTTTYIKLGLYNAELELVETAPRGYLGKPVKDEYSVTDSFECTHLALYDEIHPSDVQNLLEFGSNNKLKTIADRVGEKLAVMKNNLEYTREHLIFGALNGKILDKDGTELVDIYSKFGITKKNLTISASAPVLANEFEKIKQNLRKSAGNSLIQGWICLCSWGFFSAITGHESVKEAWKFYNQAKDYATGFDGEFSTNGIRFIIYEQDYGSGLKIGDDKAIFFPVIPDGYAEFFAPADLNDAVNTIAKPYYAIREQKPMNMGWGIHAESNPLPLPMKPQSIANLSFK